MGKHVFINERKNIVFVNNKTKMIEFKKILKPFEDMYHQFYLCQHCGHTYNDKTDLRVTNPNNAFIKAKNTALSPRLGS